MSNSRIEPKDLNKLSSNNQEILNLIPGNGLKGEYAPINVLGTLLYGENLLGDFLNYWINAKNNMTLSVKEQELIILRMGHHYNCDYVWKHHIPVATEFDVSMLQINELKKNHINFELFNLKEAALLQLCDEMIINKNISDLSWNKFNQLINPNMLIDLIHLISQYVVFALTNNVFKVEVEASLVEFSSVKH